ncbi:ABC transporter substrate-binding protein [Aliagarivorans taiwanensis]|uniref:ABC transporter substrate-binding protein n=1 Tax=Aliagarivorans taiwanensis TaxID=561966 RepID=UPI0004020894|nr:ABC transporter substrate-binding protein [Aliagarivorans taiwanensis]
MKKLLILAGLLGTCLVNAHAENRVTWTDKADIPTLDPYAFASTQALAFQNHIYEGLVEWDENYKIAPALATSWQQVDEQTIQFTLREGVRFHNGNAFDADDVVASIERVIHKDSGIRGNASSVTGATKISDYEVALTTVPYSPMVLNELTGILMMDLEWMVENGALAPSSMSNGTESYATNNTNGTGPFKLVSRRRDAGMTLVVNDDWWNSADKQHNIDRIDFKPIVSDATRLAGLISGEFSLTTDVPLQDIPRLERQNNIEVMIQPSMRVDFITLNMSDSLIASNTFNENPLQDVRVRQALMHAINRDLIVEKIMRKMTSVSNAYISPLIAGYNAANDIALDYNPEKAKQLLAEAGYPDGFNLAFDCVQGAYLNAEQWCAAVQSFWARVGVNADLNMHTRSTYSVIRDQGKTDIGVLGWANLPLVDAYSITQQLIHSKDGAIFGAFNIPNYKNAIVDEYIEQGVRELDEAKRIGLMESALQLTQQDLPYIPMHYEPVVWVASANLDVPQTSDSVVRLWRAAVK